MKFVSSFITVAHFFRFGQTGVRVMVWQRAFDVQAVQLLVQAGCGRFNTHEGKPAVLNGGTLKGT